MLLRGAELPASKFLSKGDLQLMLSLHDAFVRSRAVRFGLLVAVALAASLRPTPLLAQTISYVQGSYATPQSPQTTVSVKFNAAQIAGDLNVVVVGWNDSTATVAGVTDTAGNVYTRAVGPTAISGVESQSIYYAKNIAAAAAGANTVTVTFSTAAVYPDIRILEYSGADPANPVDVTAAGSGNSATSSSGAVTTTNPTDLLFAANIVQTTTTGPGSGFTSRLLTVPDGDIAEDRMVTAIGSYSATAPLSSGQWIMQMVAFRTPVSVTDTQPPTTPSGLTATVSGGQINLSWTASTDNVGVTGYLVERCQGTGCTTFAQIATTTVTSYSDSSLPVGSYSYRVRATDAAGNLSQYSNVASGTITDAQAPTTPSNLTAAVSGSQINLSWTASTDNIAVTGYLVERCQGTGCLNFTQIATTTTTAYSDSGLGAGSYSYRVRATDAAGNLSAYSNVASGAIADTQPPTAPSNLTATAAGTAQINLGWTASTDNAAVTGYLVERCQGAGCTTFAQIATATTTTYNDTGLAANTTYSYRVRATDAANNLSPYSNTTSATTASSSGTISYVQGSYATPQSPQTTVSVKFNAAQIAGDLNVVVVGWNDSTATVAGVTDTAGNVYTRAVGPTAISGVESQSIYYAKNIAAAAAGANTVTVTFSTAAVYPDIRILEYSGADPANPVDVTAAGSGNSATSSSGAVTTTNPTDLLFAANIVQTTTTGPGSGFTSRLLTVPDGDIAEDRMVTAIGSYSATAPLSSGQWIMQMVAFRTPVSVTDTQPPTTPSGLTATVSGGQINLSWTASTDNVGVTGYLVERCQGTGCTTFAQIATTTVTSYSDSSLPVGSYSYRVRATDAAGNLSQYSNVASGTITDAQAPTTPSNLTAAVSGSQINLSWTASTDNIAVTGYLVERCQGTGCLNFTQIATTTTTAYSDSGLGAGSYSYRVRATDAAGNLSAYSNVASGAIPDTQPPTAPSNLTATAAGTAQITLGWTASTDNVAVTGYLVERCQGAGCTTFAQIATATTTTYNDTSLTANTTYSYRVRATDAANNLSPYSNIATASTPTVPTPTAPTNLTVADGGLGPVVAAVQGYINSTFLTSHTTAPFDSTGGDLIVMCASSHAGVTFTPSDNFGNTWITIGGPTNTTTGFDLRTQLWYAPNPIVGPNHTVTMNLSAAQSLVISVIVVKGSNISSPVDAVSLIGSDNGTQTVNIVSPSITTAAANDLLLGFAKVSAGATFQPGPGYTQQTAASSNFLDAETGPASSPANYTAAFSINTQQTWQSAVVAAANNPNETTLTWGPSTETGGTISAYLVERCQGAGCSSFSQIGTTSGTTFNDTGLTASTNYSYRVRAQDTAGTLGPYSNVSSLTTPAPIPALPGNLTATAVSGTQINLSWTASTETNGTISGYLVERCQNANCNNFAQIGTSGTTSFSDTTVTGSTTYTYRVRAVDAAGNLSPYSNLAIAAMPDTQAPTAPSNLTSTAAGATQIDLSWTASTDNVGVTGYLVERCQGSGCTAFTQVATPATTTYSDTGLTANTTYNYRVRATDAAGNLSSYSNIASATTASSGAAISYVQGNYATPQTPQTTVSVKFNAAQATGDLNVVVVGWNDSTATVTGVTDTVGNVYMRAVGPTVISGSLSQSIYYAKNVGAAAAGSNTVTVTFSTAAAYPDIRILEYSGADPSSPVDVTAASSGNSTTSSSGSVTTTNAMDLIFGANIVVTLTSGPGSGFTSRLLTAPDGDIAEDRMVTATGSYSATAPLSSAGNWIMQMVAFRTPSGGVLPPTAPTNLTGLAVSPSQINLSWTASTSSVGLASYLVERCQGVGCSNFAQTASVAATLTTYVDTPLTANTSYSYRVRAADTAGNLSPYSNIATASTSLSVSPRVTSLTYTRTQQFTANFSNVVWSVDGVAGGSPSSGTITTVGLYTPPNSTGTHTVMATTSDQSASANATVYITNYPGTFTYHNDNLRTGQNLTETVLTPSNVNQAQFGKLFSYPLDGIAFASPLYVANVSIPGKGFHNVVYVATEHDTVYAFDADGLSASSLWQVSFLKSGVTTVPCADVGECGDIPNEIGITGTPVIDPSSGTMYVVAKTKEGTQYVQRLHALDITTGAEKFAGPVVLQASVPGTGSGSSGGQVPFDPLRENQRPGLLLSNGVVYIGFGSHGDNSPWHGWVLGYNASTLQQVLAYNVTPNGSGGGIWQSGGGLATDATGNLYFTTSNGDFDANTGGVDYGDTIEKLTPTGSVVDYFTPHDQLNMDVNNLDFGSAGPVLLVDQASGPYPHLLISAGKTGTIYVVNRDNMGHYNSANDNQVVQVLAGVLPGGGAEIGNFSAPVYFNGYVYFSAVNDTLKAFQLNNGLLSAAPTSQSTAIYPCRGGSFGISANANANGILWAIQNLGDPNNDATTPGVLFAYDATNLAHELYDSNQAGSRDTMDYPVKFSIPLVANGKVFIAGQTQLNAYGLLP